MSQDTAKAVIAKYIAAWNDHAIDRILDHFTPDCRYEDEALQKVMVGKDQLRAFFESMYRGFPDCEFEIIDVYDAGTCIAWEWIMKGTHNGQANLPIPPTGKAMKVRGASITHFAGGLVSRNTDYWNLAAMLKQFGLLPAAA